MIVPHLWIARRNGASFSNARCVRDRKICSALELLHKIQPTNDRHFVIFRRAKVSFPF